jgi:peptidoglycan-associated lipoprotein
VRLAGNTDERGTREYNLALGQQRADMVARFLTAEGVRPNQIETVSYGEERPADPGHNEGAWALNRRVVIVYLTK